MSEQVEMTDQFVEKKKKRESSKILKSRNKEKRRNEVFG